MAGRGFAPKPEDQRRNAHDPIRGEWQATPGIGWQHGEVPACPARSAVARQTWATWFGSWFASHWSPEDLPNLRLVIRLWAKCDSGKAIGSERTELRQLMDSYGITPKGQQDRRWQPPRSEANTAAQSAEAPATRPSRYAHLRTVAS